MEISPEMVRDCIHRIMSKHISRQLTDKEFNAAAKELTQHCYSFAGLPEPKFKEIS